MSYCLLVPGTILLLVSPAHAVTVTFAVRPDGTPIHGRLGYAAKSRSIPPRPWGVLLTPPEGDPLNIMPTLNECLSPPNSLWLCSQNGALNITFVWPNTNTSTVVSGIDLAMFTSTRVPWYGAINAYDADRWNSSVSGFFSHGVLQSRQPTTATITSPPPAALPGSSSLFQYTGIDDLIVTEASSSVDRIDVGADQGAVQLETFWEPGAGRITRGLAAPLAALASRNPALPSRRLP